MPSDITEQRKLAAIMFTDMVGYSALSQRDDRLALELLEEHRQLLRDIFPRFNGTEIKTIGDAFLVEFNSALEAAQCAIEIQRTLAKRNHDVTAERRIELKIGIHIGDVIHRSGDVYGDGVNIASRIEPLAGAGGICVSMDVERQIRNALEARFEKLARTELKNISVAMDLFRIVLPWESNPGLNPKRRETRKQRSMPVGWLVAAALLIVAALIVVGVLFMIGRERQSQGQITQSGRPEDPSLPISEKSIAVLPFENLSHDPGNIYFSDGIQEEILTRLAKIAELKVISRTSTQRFKSSPGDLRQIAQQLGVTNILEGSVQKEGDRVRVNVQLINGATDAHLWADTFDRKLTDIFAVESEIAKTVAETLRAKLTGSERAAVAKVPTANSEAYELYLKGRFFWNKRTSADLRKAIEYFNQAIAKDPNYARAYVGLADSYTLLPSFGAAAPRDSIPQAKAAVKKALELDDTLGEAYATSAQIRAEHDLEFEQGITEFERAIELSPNYATAHQWFASGPLEALARFDRAIAEGKRAVELDPLSLIVNVDLGYVYLNARRYDEAIAQYRKTIEIDSQFYMAHYYLGEALQLKGQLTEAIAAYRTAVELNDDPIALALLGQAHARAGQMEEAQKILARLTEEAKSRYVSGYSFALVLTALGDKEGAVDALERAYRNGEGNDLRIMKVDPMLDDLRGHPRFEALVQRVVAPKTNGRQ
ncbi:MAG TPA: tetratricopeptide repeat protein [Chthoniobacterales bacterium]|nr:tetratricopeptide repeat protein [Chthoniobacterales bacterium]